METSRIWPPLVELILARLREFVREPEALFWTFVFPILMAIAMAIAFPSDEAEPVVLVGIEAGAVAEDVRASLVASGRVTIREIPAGGLVRALREGEVHVVVEGSRPPTYRFDPAHEESVIARLVLDDILMGADGRQDPWTPAEVPMRIAGSRYVDWLIPGIIGMTIMSTSLWGIAFSIVQFRLRKLLKRMVASPMRKRDYLLAQVLARMVFLAPEVLVTLGFAMLVLGMPVAGRAIDIAIVSVVGALGFGGLGLLVASRARTFEAVSGMLNFLMLPMWVLSGVFFSSSNFPDAIQPFIQVLPLTALVDGLRTVILDGETAAAAGRELATLGVWGVGGFSVALKIFSWR